MDDLERVGTCRNYRTLMLSSAVLFTKTEQDAPGVSRFAVDDSDSNATYHETREHKRKEG